MKTRVDSPLVRISRTFRFEPKIVVPPTMPIASETRVSLVSAKVPGSRTSPNTVTAMLCEELTETVARASRLKRPTRCSISRAISSTVRPDACTSPIRSIEIMPSGRTTAERSITGSGRIETNSWSGGPTT